MKAPSMARAVFAALRALVSGRLTRYEIADHSMEPTLRNGDWVLGERRARRLLPGDVVVVTHPNRSDFEVVKRIAAVSPDGVDVRGDSPDHSEDSGTFGPVPIESVRARLLIVYRPRPIRPLGPGA